MIAVTPCSAPPAGLGLLGGLLNYVDCQTQALGAGGYQALSAQGSSVSLALTGMLVLFVALLGYRLVFGQTPGVRDGVLMMIKIGVVLALAANWPAYRTLAYDVTLRAPAEVASEIGAPAALPGAGGGLVARLDALDHAFITLAIAEQRLPPPVVPAAAGTPPTTPFDTYALGGARIVYLTAAAAALGAVRLVAGLLLALGPLFIAFLLFGGTRGLFEGWVRGLAGAALGALGAGITLGIELALLEPRLSELVMRRSAGEAITGSGVELLVIALVFALVLVAMLVATARVALAVRVPWGSEQALRETPAGLAEERHFLRQITARAAAGGEGRTRAVAVADAVAATQRRETMMVTGTAADGPPSRRVAASAPLHNAPVTTVSPLGQSFRRRTQGRVSVASSRRDGA